MPVMPSRSRRRAGVVGVALLLCLGAVVTLAQPAAAATTASFTVTSSWETGYTGQYTIANSGPGTITGWQVSFDLPAGTTVGTFWDALLTRSGDHYAFGNRDYNAIIAVGASTSFGFVASGTARPANCTVNGAACTGGGGGTTTTTTRPATTTTTGPTTTTTRPGGGGSFRSVPYYMPFDNSPQDLGEVISQTGERNFVLAFVLAPSSGGCAPTWDGSRPVSGDSAVTAKINQVRAAGGDVSVSFGGFNGIELGAACSSATALADAYQQVIDGYGLTHIDLDIEGDDLGDVAGETRRFQAINLLRQRGRSLEVTLTLPVTTVGLSDLGKAEISRAASLGTTIDVYKAMIFDYGGPGGQMAQSVTQVAEAINQQLRQLFPSLTAAQAYARTGITLMNGHTDQPSELFTQDTFRSVLAYAQQHHVNRLSFWSVNRDRPCNPDTGAWVSGVCSSIPQQPYDFTRIIVQYTG